MAYTALSPSALRVPTDYGQTDWLNTYNYNWNHLNANLLRLYGLLDTNLVLSDGDALRYNSVSGYWEAWQPPYPAQSTTTTTTTTTTV